MISNDLYNKLDIDFKVNDIGCEPWEIDTIKEYVTENFLEHNEGIMLDNSKEINKVYSVTFPDTNLLKRILDKGEQDILVFSHHAQTWQFGNGEDVMVNLPTEILDEMKEKRVSLYSIHIPLDNVSKYSTSVTFAKKLNIKDEKNAFEYLNALTGLFGKTDYSNVYEFSNFIESIIGHKTKVYNYGTSDILNNTVAVVAGCGNEVEVIEELKDNHVNTLVTGFSTNLENNPEHGCAEDAIAAHKCAQGNKINIIGTTHYSSEKFACMEMIKYFEKLCIPSEFMEGHHNLKDL